MKSDKSELIIYQTDDGRTLIETRLENETVWLTQPMMAELFQTTQQNISQHIQNIYEEGELTPQSTHKDFLLVRREGSREVQGELAHYNLDMILSVGYRVKSVIATRFRIWATQRLREYIVKGFTMNDELLKQAGGGNYFDELLEMTGSNALDHASTISHQQAVEKATIEYEKYKELHKNDLSEAERHFVRQIEQTAKKLEPKKKK